MMIMISYCLHNKTKDPRMLLPSPPCDTAIGMYLGLVFIERTLTAINVSVVNSDMLVTVRTTLLVLQAYKICQKGRLVKDI